jgi:sirohydrochlorin ferrochelatase
MKALLLIAHGSRRKQSNDEVVILADRLKLNCSEQYKIIHAGFLELAETLIPDGIKKCVDDGATSIVNETKPHYPNINIKIAPHLGASNLMMELLITTANATE